MKRPVLTCCIYHTSDISKDVICVWTPSVHVVMQVCFVFLICCADGPTAGIPAELTGPAPISASCPCLSSNYLAMQHIIQSSRIQTSAQSSQQPELFLPSQQILWVLAIQGKGLSGSVSSTGSICVRANAAHGTLVLYNSSKPCHIAKLRCDSLFH